MFPQNYPKFLISVETSTRENIKSETPKQLNEIQVY